MRPVGMGGPVGFAHALAGFTVAFLVARVWENLANEAHCIPACPSLQSELFRLHHFYYGLGILIPSLIVLAGAMRQRLRWEAALFLGIGVALSTDEVGLLFLGVPYRSLVSLLIPVSLGVVLLIGAVNAIRRDDWHEFWVLDHNDIMTASSVLLGIVGVLYLDRPVNELAAIIGSLSWALAVQFIVLSGKRHFVRIFAISH